MQKITNCCVVACLTLASLSFEANPAHAIPIRDQGQIFSTGGLLDLGTDSWSQSITTGIAGQLTGIQILIEVIYFDPPPILGFEFSVFDGDNPPVSPALLSQQLSIPRAVLEPHPGLYTWDVTNANLLFDVGDIFTFALSAQQDGFIISGNDPPGYAGGELFRNGTALPSSAVNDMAFITYVDPTQVPEASTLALISIGLIGLGFMMLRHPRQRHARLCAIPQTGNDPVQVRNSAVLASITKPSPE